MDALLPGVDSALLNEKLTGAVISRVPRKRSRILERYMPLTPVDADRVKEEHVLMNSYGKSPIVASGTPSPIFDFEMNSTGEMSWEAVEVREKVVNNAELFRNIREWGSCDSEVDKNKVLTFIESVIKNRAENTLDWMRSQVFTTGVLDVTPKEGVASVVIDYRHPDQMKLTAAIPWINYNTSDPLGDIASMKQLLPHTATYGESFDLLLTSKALDSMVRSDQIRDIGRDLFKYNDNGTSWDDAIVRRTNVPSAADRVIKSELGSNFNIVVVDDGIEYASMTTGTALAGATVVSLRSVEGFNVGQLVDLYHPTQRFYHNNAEITAVDPVAKTITFAGHALLTAMPANTQARTLYQYINDNTVLMFPVLDTSVYDPQYMQQLSMGAGMVEIPTAVAQMVTTRNRYHINDNRPGWFAHFGPGAVDPPSDMLVIGINALPRVIDASGWIIGTV